VRKWKAARKKGQTPQLFAVSRFDPQLDGQNTTSICDAPPTQESAVTITVNLSLIWQLVEETREASK
jgi:hypothetical protein